MITRRRFMAGSAVMAASPFLCLGGETKGRLEHIGFISGVLRNELKGDWRSVLKQAVSYGFTEYEAHRQGIQHYFVERDKIVDGLACLQTSGAYLQSLSF